MSPQPVVIPSAPPEQHLHIPSKHITNTAGSAEHGWHLRFTYFSWDYFSFLIHSTLTQINPALAQFISAVGVECKALMVPGHQPALQSLQDTPRHKSYLEIQTLKQSGHVSWVTRLPGQPQNNKKNHIKKAFSYSESKPPLWQTVHCNWTVQGNKTSAPSQHMIHTTKCFVSLL